MSVLSVGENAAREGVRQGVGEGKDQGSQQQGHASPLICRPHSALDGSRILVCKGGKKVFYVHASSLRILEYPTNYTIPAAFENLDERIKS